LPGRSSLCTPRAISAAHALPHVDVGDAAALVVLGAEKKPTGFYRRGGFAGSRATQTENPGVDLSEAQLVVAALSARTAEGSAARALDAAQRGYKGQNKRDSVRRQDSVPPANRGDSAL
jgi:hypothetical protein